MEAERVRAQLDRILASAAFADADRAGRFLRFVVERTLDGRAGEIKESVIGVEVLGVKNTSSHSNGRIWFDLSLTNPYIYVAVLIRLERLRHTRHGWSQTQPETDDEGKRSSNATRPGKNF
jgi:hypothetical protein